MRTRPVVSHRMLFKRGEKPKARTVQVSRKPSFFEGKSIGVLGRPREPAPKKREKKKGKRGGGQKRSRLQIQIGTGPKKGEILCANAHRSKWSKRTGLRQKTPGMEKRGQMKGALDVKKSVGLAKGVRQFRKQPTIETRLVPRLENKKNPPYAGSRPSSKKGGTR